MQVPSKEDSVWLSIEGAKKKKFKLGQYVGKGDHKGACEILGTDFVIFFPLKVSPDSSLWFEVVQDEVSTCQKLSKLDICNARSKKVEVFSDKGESFPTYISWSFESLSKKRKWFVIDDKNPESSTWRRSMTVTTETASSSFSWNSFLKSLQNFLFPKKPKTEFIVPPKGFLRGSSERVDLNAWIRILTPLIRDVWVIYKNGIILDTDGSLNLVAIPDEDGGYYVRYFGFDFRAMPFHCRSNIQTIEELKKEVHNIIYVLIQNVFREQSEYEYAEMRTTFLKEPRKLAPPTYKEMAFPEFFDKNYTDLLHYEYLDFLDTLNLNFGQVATFEKNAVSNILNLSESNSLQLAEKCVK